MTRRPSSTSQTRGDAAAAPPQLLTPEDVAAWLGTTRRAVYARLDRGQFRAAVIRVGRRLYFRSDILLASLSQQGRVP
jgi:helix-turn-helix protein